MSKMMVRYGLLKPIKEFAKKNNIFGTCAGLILMSNYSLDGITPLKLIDVDVLRNGWGRQINSFTENINLNIQENINLFKATFIRAPKIKKVPNTVTVLSCLNDEPIMIRQGRHIATTFHPEMHQDSTIHKYFIDLINGRT